jgi:hypothetical protein
MPRMKLLCTGVIALLCATSSAFGQAQRVEKPAAEQVAVEMLRQSQALAQQYSGNAAQWQRPDASAPGLSVLGG